MIGLSPGLILKHPEKRCARAFGLCRAAAWRAVGFRFRLMSSNEGAYELAVELRSNGLHVLNILPLQKLPRILDVVDARGFDLDVLETGGG